MGSHIIKLRVHHFVKEETCEKKLEERKERERGANKQRVKTELLNGDILIYKFMVPLQSINSAMFAPSSTALDLMCAFQL